MVEVFSTNIQNEEEANLILKKLRYHYPAHKINFDLEDCDKILRIAGEDICISIVTELFELHGFQCIMLE